MARALIESRKARLARRLSDRPTSFVIAESCTGGRLAALFAGDAALGPHLERGYVAYSIDAKCEQLGVARRDAERNDAVNAEVAAAMAKGALKNSRADISIAITGFCGPQEKNEEVGLVFLACVDRHHGFRERICHFGDLGREAVLEQAVAEALMLMIEAVDTRRP
jgi:nicotinamide-nucleotide amidase